MFAGWFAARGWTLREHQKQLLARAMAGRSSLLIAPTGAGKTLAGFLPSLVELAEIAPRPQRAHKLHTLYISPLKALAGDVLRNLTTPCAEMGLQLRIETRTGDTPPSKRQRQRANPPDILLTTPEQLCLLIASAHAHVFFADLRAVIIDEIHALAATKRGDLTALALARLQTWAPTHRRIGLSATVADPAALADWLAPTQNDIVVTAPGGAEPIVDVLDSGERIPWAGHTGRHAMGEVYEAIKAHKTTLVFVNTRAQAELTFQELWRLNEDTLPIALHHGSLDVAQRKRVESAMGVGALRAVVCTSTLDLGIDWGDVDLVIQMGAPKGSARLMQRIGRANHRWDEASRALLVPTNRFEVLECRAAKDAVGEGALDGSPARAGGLDCLAQHIMGVACSEPFDAELLWREISATQPYRDLDHLTFERVIDLVATGGYALRAYDRYRRIVKDLKTGLWRARDGRAAQQHRMNVGAIIEEPMLTVRYGYGGSEAVKGKSGKGPLRPGRKLGQIEEYFIEGLAPGDTFLFAGQILRFISLVETDALVAPAPQTQAPKIPSYAGGKFPLSTFLADRVRQIISNPEKWPALPVQVREWLALQKRASAIAKPNQLLVETFPRAGKYYLVCYPFDGRLAHQTLGMLLTRRLERAGKKPMGFVASDYAISVWGLEPMGDLDLGDLFHPDMLGDDLESWLAESALMKRTFRACAIIAGLIERRSPGAEKSGRQVTFSTDLIYDVLRSHEPDHVLLQAARADAAGGLLDISRLSDLLARIKGRIVHKDLAVISPFAVPLMLEVGREPIFGAAEEAILREAGEGMIAEARAGHQPLPDSAPA
jgi:ATP-dependent Lhr-like helicase